MKFTLLPQEVVFIDYLPASFKTKYMRHLLKLKSVLFGFFVITITVSSWAQTSYAQNLDGGSQAGREFIMSCTYGVMAGTLVGAASLAFEEQPGEKLHKIARGASIGLYAGILLGVYVVYILPSQLERQQQQQLEESIQDSARFRLFEPPRLSLRPTFNYRSGAIDGAAADYTVLRF